MKSSILPQKTPINPIIILLGILILAMFMTYFIDSGSYQRDGKLVIPGSYEVIQKDSSLSNVLATTNVAEGNVAQPVSLISTLHTIPAGLEKMAGLIFMVLIIGGMFGILTASGAIDASLERFLGIMRGKVYVLVPCLMIVFSAGSTFLGLASEYLLIIPMIVLMAERLGLSKVIGLAIVAVAVKAGYLSSVTNPLPLTIAQPLVGLQVFSGAGLRFIYYLFFVTFGIGFVLLMIRRSGYDQSVTVEFNTTKLSNRHSAMMLTLVIGVCFLVYGSNHWRWGHEELSTVYVGLSIILAMAGGLNPSAAANAFVGGMKKILMASFLIGVATAVALTLQKGQILDTIVYHLTGLIGEGGALASALGMFGGQLLLDVLIPSTSGQAAISMPIMGPIGQLSGVQPQTIVTTFLFGNGITNMITPTSGTLLAYLATAGVSWGEWARFIFPLWLFFIGLAILLISATVMMGF
jgi:uncharacterized ion transporter superfamily protein YfcC